MNHTLSIVSFLQYFCLGVVGFVALIRTWRSLRRLRGFSQLKRRLKGQPAAVFMTAHRCQDDSQAPKTSD